MLAGSFMTVKTFDVLDLVNMVAAQHDWDLRLRERRTR